MTDVMYKRYERNKQGKKKQAYSQKVQKGNRHTCYTARSLSFDLWNMFHSSHTVQ